MIEPAATPGAFFLFHVALLAKPPPTPAVRFLHHALTARQDLHFLPVADFPTGNAVNRRSYAVENDDRTAGITKNALVGFVQLLAGFKVEIFLRLAAPVDLALAVVIGLYLPFQPGEERVRVLYRLTGLAAAMSVRVVEQSNRSCWVGSVVPACGN